jgi:hypothetical protein
VQPTGARGPAADIKARWVSTPTGLVRDHRAAAKRCTRSTVSLSSSGPVSGASIVSVVVSIVSTVAARVVVSIVAAGVVVLIVVATLVVSAVVVVVVAALARSAAVVVRG